MSEKALLPMDLQFFADGGEGGAQGAEQQPGTQAAGAAGATPPAGQTAARATDMTAMADTLIKAIESRTQRAENSVLKSMAEQYGMRETELTAILDAAKAEKAKQLPEEAVKQITAATERANGLLLIAEVKSIGAEMGLIDPETALLLMDKAKVKVDASGAVTGAKEALETLKQAKPYLFGSRGAMAQRLGGSPAAAADGVEAAFYKRNPNLKER